MWQRLGPAIKYYSRILWHGVAGQDKPSEADDSTKAQGPSSRSGFWKEFREGQREADARGSKRDS